MPDEEEWILEDKDCVKVLERFLSQSYRKGYVSLKEDFETLMQAVNRGIAWYYEIHGNTDRIPYWVEIDPKVCQLDGPFECPNCGYHIMLDVTYMDQVDDCCKCPNCGQINQVPEED